MSSLMLYRLIEPVEGYEGAIALQDLVAIAKCIISMSRETCIEDIEVVAMRSNINNSFYH